MTVEQFVLERPIGVRIDSLRVEHRDPHAADGAKVIATFDLSLIGHLKVYGCSLMRYPDGRHGTLGPSAITRTGSHLRITFDRSSGLKKVITGAAVARYHEAVGELAAEILPSPERDTGQA